MEFWQDAEIKNFFRETRERQGKRLKDVAVKGQLSLSTASNIEGLKSPHVTREKVQLYCVNLGLNLDDVPRLIDDQRKRDQKTEAFLHIKLKAIQSILDAVSAKEAKKKLQEIEVPKVTKARGFYYYLLGRCYIKSQKWRSAEKVFFDVLNICHDSPEVHSSNLQSGCYYELSRCSWHHENNLKKALKYIKQGLSLFQRNGENRDFEFLLLLSQALYYEKLEQSEKIN